MKKTKDFYWFIGLFEGEGSFSMTGEKASRITITSTDRDVLEKVISIVGGTIVQPIKRKEHWKQEYVWYTDRINSKEITLKMLSFLSERRCKRAKEWLELCNKNIEKQKIKTLKISKAYDKIISLHKQGFIQSKIAEEVGYERSHISKILKKLKVVEDVTDITTA